MYDLFKLIDWFTYISKGWLNTLNGGISIIKGQFDTLKYVLYTRITNGRFDTLFGAIYKNKHLFRYFK